MISWALRKSVGCTNVSTSPMGHPARRGKMPRAIPVFLRATRLMPFRSISFATRSNCVMKRLSRLSTAPIDADHRGEIAAAPRTLRSAKAATLSARFVVAQAHADSSPAALQSDTSSRSCQDGSSAKAQQRNRSGGDSLLGHTIPISFLVGSIELWHRLGRGSGAKGLETLNVTTSVGTPEVHLHPGPGPAATFQQELRIRSKTLNCDEHTF